MSAGVNGISCPSSYSSPLLPVSIGLVARLTGDLALAAKWLGVMMNTLAVGLAMMVIRQLFPTRPVLAWFTGSGLAVNHVWCRLAPFALTENFFYPLLMALFLASAAFAATTHLVERTGVGNLLGSTLYLSREIGLYYWRPGFFGLAGGSEWWQNRRSGDKIHQYLTLGKDSLPVVPVLAVILVIWMYWFYTSLGIVSLGEGQRFYATYTRQFDRQSESTYPGYDHGEFAFFRLHPSRINGVYPISSSGRSHAIPRAPPGDVCPSH